MKYFSLHSVNLDIRIRAAMRVVQPKTVKYNNKTETAFKYAVFIRNRTRFERLIKKMNIPARRSEMRYEMRKYHFGDFLYILL